MTSTQTQTDPDQDTADGVCLHRVVFDARRFDVRVAMPQDLMGWTAGTWAHREAAGPRTQGVNVCAPDAATLRHIARELEAAADRIDAGDYPNLDEPRQ